jgi:bifunctional non-homologous end joining protein LigD
MPLKKYEEKRTFSKTPEPPPQEGSSPGGNFFCVQRHHATRLHYDLRLEVDGALASWAVPKGPTLVPGDKRLAMHVEDHPLDYGNFEGNIPKGNYGAGSVMLWDRGTYELLGKPGSTAKEQVDAGDFKFRLNGVKLRGEFALVRMKGRGKGDEWLLLKKKDDVADPEWDPEDHAWSILTGRTQEEIASNLPARKRAKGSKRHMPKGAVEAPMPDSIMPMKAQLTDKVPTGEGWLYEIKWDGIRAICFVNQGRLRIDSRRGNSCERQYPEMSVLPQFVDARQAIIDAEIAVLDDKGRPNFGMIQPRIMASDANAIANLARSRPATLFAFDLLHLDGYDLRGVPLEQRKDLLREILKPAPHIRLSDDFSDGEMLFQAAREQELEGVLAKRRSSIYEPKRSDSWLKVKTSQEQDFVICGLTAGERDHFGSLALGAFSKGKLIYVGNVGTGFTEKSIADIYKHLEALKASECPFAKVPKIAGGPTTWLRPEVACTVKYGSWTHEKHLRAPVFVGLRPDLDPRECLLDPTEQEEAPAPGDSKSKAPGIRPALLTGTEEQTFVTIDGTRLKFTNLNKVFFPEDGYTKRDLINYYDAVADFVLPHLKDRPLSLKRYPNGIHGGHFFQKDSPESFPDWLRFHEIFSEDKKDTIRYVLAEDRAALLYLANLACIDHNPFMSRAGSLDQPDWVLIDLDPVECSYDMIVEAARLVQDKLEKIGLTGYPKTTGGDGMHVYIPVEPRYSYEDTRQFAEILGALVIAEKPALFTTPRSVSKREKGRVYFDHMQNASFKTIAAPYVLRAHPGAPVSTPLEWREVRKGLRPEQFTIRNAPERFAKMGDLFRGVLEKPQAIEPAIERLESLIKG